MDSIDYKWLIAQLSPQERFNHMEDLYTRVIRQSISASLNMYVSGGTDIDIIIARLAAAKEIADGLGVSIDIPTSRTLLLKKIGSIISDMAKNL